MAEPSTAKVISRGTAVSVPTTSIDLSFLAILSRAFAQGHRLHCFAMGGFKGSKVCVCTCMCECVSINPETMSTKHSVSPETSAYTRSSIYTVRPLSILFQVSFLHLLSLLAGQSVSCKPSPSISIPLFTEHSFCYEPSMSTQPNLSNELSVP